MNLFWILLAIAGLALNSIRVVKQQTVVVVERFGKFSRVLTPGLNWIIPVVDRAVDTMSLKVIPIEAEVSIKTADNMFVDLPVSLMLRVDETKAKEAYYSLEDPSGQISTWVLNALRAITSSMSLTDLYEDRERIASEVSTDLAERLTSYGYTIEAVLVDQPTVSEDVQESFNRVVASERDKDAATQQAEAKKILMVGQARAESEAQELRAQGLANARKILVNNLTETVAAAKATGISEGDIMTLLLETSRLDTIKSASEHGKMVLMDVRSPVRPTLELGHD